MNFKLSLRLGDKLINSYEFEKDIVTIGREPKCDVFIDNLAISRLHAVIERHDIFFVLKDMDSDNGVFIRDGQRIKRYTLNKGDEFFIGKYTFTFDQTEDEMTEQEIPKLEKEPKIEVNVYSPLTMAVDDRQMLLLQKKRDTLAAYLSVIEPSGVKRNIPLANSPVFFGTHPTSNFVLKGWHITRRHALIFHDSKSFYIYHLGDKKPPKVNDQEIDYSSLKDGDRIDIGDYQITFHVGSP